MLAEFLLLYFFLESTFTKPGILSLLAKEPLSFEQTTGCFRVGKHTLVTLPRIVTPYRDSVNGTRARVTYQKLVMR